MKKLVFIFFILCNSIFSYPRAPNFFLTDISGTTYSINSFKNKNILLFFWVSWCPSCTSLLPTINNLSNKFSDSNFILIGINNEEKNLIDTFLKNNSYTFLNLYTTPDSQIYSDYPIEAFPTMYFISSSGEVKSFVQGSITEKKLENEIYSLISSN